MLKKKPQTFPPCTYPAYCTGIGYFFRELDSIGRVEKGVPQRLSPELGWIPWEGVLEDMCDVENWSWGGASLGVKEPHDPMVQKLNRVYSKEHGIDKQLVLALKIATAAHRGQKDLGGLDYIMHPLHVADACFIDSEKCIALLHDVLEDTPETAESLRAKGVADWVIDAVLTLTRKEGESYDEYIVRVGKEKFPRVVKIEDLKHNMDLSRIKNPTQEDYDRVAVYRNALEYLESIEYDNPFNCEEIRLNGLTIAQQRKFDEICAKNWEGVLNPVGIEKVKSYIDPDF